MTETHEARIARLGIQIPAAPALRAAKIQMARKLGNVLYVSGQLPTIGTELSFVGRVGDHLDLNQAKQAAYRSGLNVLAQARAALPGGLDDVISVVNLRGFVACAAHFTQIAEVVNGASELMVEVFGEAGAHTRSALGVTSMPHGVVVEIEAMFEVR